MKVAPPPKVRSTPISPPWAVMIALQIARPIPLERLPSPRWNGSKIRIVLVLGHALAAIGDLHPDDALVGLRDDPHVGAGWRVACRVGEEVGEHPLDLGVVSIDEREVVRAAACGAEVGEDREPGAGPIPHELVEVDGLPVRVECPGFDAAQAEEVVDEPVEPVDLVAHHREELRPRLLVVRDPVTEVGGHRSDRGQRACEGRATPSGAARCAGRRCGRGRRPARLVC